MSNPNQYGDPFGEKRATKAAVKSQGILGSALALVSTVAMAYASYQANGAISDAEIGALMVSVTGLGFAIKGRWRADRPIGSLF